MDDLSQQKLESIASSYEELLVPAMFEDCSQYILNIARPKSGDRVLDVASGTGVLARAVAERLGPNGSVVGLDLNPGMLSVAEQLAPDLEWREGRAEELPFEDRTFDLVACQFSLMFFENKIAAVQEMLRVLKPDGKLVVTVFDSLDQIPVYKTLVDIYTDAAGGEIGQFLKAPFTLGNSGDLEELFVESGFSSPVIKSYDITADFPSVEKMIRADVDGWFPLAGIELDDAQVDEVIAETETALTEYIAEDGGIAFTMPAYFVTNFDY